MRCQASLGSESGAGKADELMSLTLEELEVKKAAAVDGEDYDTAKHIKGVIAKKEAEAAAAVQRQESTETVADVDTQLREEVAQLKAMVVKLRTEMEEREEEMHNFFTVTTDYSSAVNYE